MRNVHCLQQRLRYVFKVYAQESALDAAGAPELVHGIDDRTYRYCEPDAVVSTGGRCDQRIDADQQTCPIHQQSIWCRN